MHGWRRFVQPVLQDYVRSINLVYPADLVRRVFRLSAAGSYVTGEITATRITCSGPADTHSFSSTFSRSAIVSIYLFALCLKLHHFYPIRLSLSLKALFPLVYSHYSSFPPFTALFFFLFISVTLAASQNSQLRLCSSASLCPFPLYHLPSTVSALGIVAFFIPLCFHLGSCSDITNATARWLWAKSARQ